MKVDAFILCLYKDLNKLPYVIDGLIKNCNDIADIHVSMPDKHDNVNYEINGHKIIFHNDFDILNIPYLKLCRFRPNWIYKQMINLCQNVTNTRYYYAIDCDIIPVNHIDLFKDSKAIMFKCINENDESGFIRYIAKATGGDLAQFNKDDYAKTFYISDMMLFDKTIVDEMIKRYFVNYNEFNLFTIMNSYYDGIRSNSMFIAEYEMYGLYVKKYHSNEIFEYEITRRDITRRQYDQNQQIFSTDEIELGIKEAKEENKDFLKLQSGCFMSNIAYKTECRK